MSLKLKIIIVLTSWLLFILLLCNVFIYFLFIRFTTESEMELLKEKARSLIRKDLPVHPEYWKKPSPLEELLIPQEMIRYILPGPEVIYQIYSDEELLKKPANFETKEKTSVIRNEDKVYVYVMMPVYVQGHQIATLEIGRSLGDIGNYLQTLVTVLVSVSTGAVILSVLGGYFYTRIVFKPLDQLIETMQIIEESGVFRRIQLPSTPSDDELFRLGATFNRMIERLEENFYRQEQFLADASHELRTPLTIIESYVSLLRRWAASDPKLREEALDAIQSESSHLKTLTQNLLSLINNEEGQREEWAVFDLTPLVLSTAASLKLTFNRSIQTTLPDNDNKQLLLFGNPSKIKQLLIILLDNALKYSKHSIQIILQEQSRYIQIDVIDHGIGVAEADIPHLFDRFYRTDKARNRKQGGVGLGLAIADHIVRAHKGTIKLSTLPGKGTTVTVKLPTL